MKVEINISRGGVWRIMMSSSTLSVAMLTCGSGLMENDRILRGQFERLTRSAMWI